ncbi:MAG: hypothetical protein L0Z50_35585, partial [Verrucomicrobiales bacterium]|nr:hypothetical protein [Verrucomicrobiales bacterium]
MEVARIPKPRKTYVASSLQQMSPLQAIFLVLVTWLSTGHRVNAQELPLFGQLPTPEKNWKLREKKKSGDSPVSWSWVVLTNFESADVLSFAAHKLGPGEPRELISLSDTAREIFPAGYPVWIPGSKQHFTIYPIRN